MNLSKIFGILLFFILSLSACKKDTPCKSLMFGIPNNKTGLSTSVCKPVCECGDFASTSFTQAQLDDLKTWVLYDTISELSVNPYDFPVITLPESVCAIKVEDLNAKIYSLQNYNSPKEALADGAILTHYDACGKCSTLQDFVVYADNIDIGSDVRQCILANFTSPFDTLVACIETLGFTKPCAQIWAYNAKNTQAECLAVCLADTTYNKPNGQLSDCLQCDETKSGPVFKAVSGRTRRNTGIASSICRYCEEVQYVPHDYPQ
jgi:hypothetical protein